MRALQMMIMALMGASLAACVGAPKALRGDFAPLTPHEAVMHPASGALVRWGGQLIETVPMPDRTCFQILSRPLGSNSRPVERHRDRNDGRFIACHAGFHDPEVFRAGREVTITGHVDGQQQITVGEYHYTVPRVSARSVHLWPLRPLVVESRDYWHHDPFWRGSFGWPYYRYPAPIIVRPVPPPRPD